MSDTIVDRVEKAPLPTIRPWFGASSRLWIGGLAASAAWTAVALLTRLWPDTPESDWAQTGGLAIAFGAFAVLLPVATVAGLWSPMLRKLQRSAPWLIVLAFFFAAWEAATAKLGLLPMPFFPPPQAISEVVVDDWARLAESVVASVRLLAGGYVLGAAIGFVAGVAIGWSRAIG